MDVGEAGSNPHRVMLIRMGFSLIWNNQNLNVLKQMAKPLVTSKTDISLILGCLLCTVCLVYHFIRMKQFHPYKMVDHIIPRNFGFYTTVNSDWIKGVRWVLFAEPIRERHKRTNQ